MKTDSHLNVVHGVSKMMKRKLMEKMSTMVFRMIVKMKTFVAMTARSSKISRTKGRVNKLSPTMTMPFMFLKKTKWIKKVFTVHSTWVGVVLI